jgi:hypothetical protein
LKQSLRDAEPQANLGKRLLGALEEMLFKVVYRFFRLAGICSETSLQNPTRARFCKQAAIQPLAVKKYYATFNFTVIILRKEIVEYL